MARLLVVATVTMLVLQTTVCGQTAALRDLPTSQAELCALRDNLAAALKAYRNLNWPAIRDACSAQVDTAEKRDLVGFSWFANAGNGFVGTPLVIQKILPDLAPEIWGQPDDLFQSFGLFTDPNQPSRILPRGLGVTATSGRPVNATGNVLGEIDYTKPDLYIVTLACGACHTGQAIGPNGRIVLEGAPNTQFDVRKWRQAFSMTRQRYLSREQIGTPDAPGDTTQRIIAIIDSKPVGFFARGLPGLKDDAIAAVDGMQRAVVKGRIVPILEAFSSGTGVRAAAVILQARPGSSYGHGDRSPPLGGFSAGQSDGSGDLLADLLAAQTLGSGMDLQTFLGGTYAELPPFATVTDSPSVWNQEKRSVGQWDGSVLNSFWRNIAAQLPIVGDPRKLDLHNTHIVADFLRGLPAPPYPFEVNLDRAARGEELFNRHCSDCHRPANNRQYWELHTDFNRAQVLTRAGAALLTSAFRAACHDKDFAYTDRNGTRVQPCIAPDNHILKDTTAAQNQGYIAGVLDGIWARAPYLHNGSVPSLMHLLKPMTRPERFLRGVIEYDTTNVGWIWNVEFKNTYKANMPTMSEHDTRRDGWTNVGHDKDIVVDGKSYQLDWSNPMRAEALRDLIEYLKTI
ncbi:hypothetical protein [Mesorhizobium sp. M0296]|uniref:c-type cytochrome n=1 Tax=Mesorhizobium sp. M0296 TaxID=2956931 RepID=UPI003335D2BF